MTIKAKALRDQLMAWHGVALPPALAAEIAAAAETYGELTGGSPLTLAFDDEPGHFARVVAGKAPAEPGR